MLSLYHAHDVPHRGSQREMTWCVQSHIETRWEDVLWNELATQMCTTFRSNPVLLMYLRVSLGGWSSPCEKTLAKPTSWLQIWGGVTGQLHAKGMWH